MAISYLGTFNLYVPEPDEDNPITTIPGILFSRNENGEDFYNVRNGVPGNSLVVILDPIADRIVGASRGELMAFPSAGQRLFALSGVDATEPESVLGMALDTLSGTISPAPSAVTTQITLKADIFRRASEEQAQAMRSMFESQPVRIQEIFKAALHIDHSDDLFALLLDGLTQLFGAEEATRLLAIS